MFTCKECGQSFEKRGQLAGHIKYIHKAQKREDSPSPEVLSEVTAELFPETVTSDATVEIQPDTEQPIRPNATLPPPPPPPSPPPDVKGIIEGVIRAVVPAIMETMEKRLAEDREATKTALAQAQQNLAEAMGAIAEVLEKREAADNSSSPIEKYLPYLFPKPDGGGNLLQQLEMLEKIGNIVGRPRQEGFTEGSNFASNVFLMATKGGASPEKAAEAVRQFIPPPKKAGGQ